MAVKVSTPTMKRVALILLAALTLEAVIYFQQHQVKLLKVHLGERACSP
jgi:hypothetical protein